MQQQRAIARKEKKQHRTIVTAIPEDAIHCSLYGCVNKCHFVLLLQAMLRSTNKGQKKDDDVIAIIPTFWTVKKKVIVWNRDA